MNTLSQIFSTLGDVALFRSITNYIDARIAFFTESTLATVMTVVGTVALILLTLWIMWYGYQMVMGSSQHSAKDFVFKAVRAWIIIACATGLAASMGFSIRTLTTTMSDAISQSLTNSDDASACTTSPGSSGFMGCKIDQNLLRTQAAMAFVNQLDTGGDPVLEDKKTHASLMMSAGIGGPAIVAGALLLTLKVAMALFIALGPIFIMCLLFKQTTGLFQKWLYYGLSTMFATAMLAVVSDISMDLVENISATLFAADMFSQVTGISALSSNTAGIMQASVQQLGLGLILSTLLISTPPMAANFFNGVMGSFNHVSALGTFGHAPTSQTTTTQGAPGAPGAPASPAPGNTAGTPNTQPSAPAPTQPYIPNSNAAVNKDVIKTDSALGNANKNFAASEVASADRTIKDPGPPPIPAPPPKSQG